MNPSLLDTLRTLVGAAQVLQGDGLEAYEVDWRKRYRGRALAVVRPGSADEVAAVVRACVAAGVAIVPQGGNTGLVGGGVPDASGTQVLLSLSRLSRIREIDADNLTLTAEAGCVLQAIQEAADARGLLFPLSLAAEGSCTIGGNLATNAGGTQVLRYGNARELCLGVEAVTPTGELWNGLTGLRKNNTGYDLRDLLVGSEGTLGVITAATLKLYPAPSAVVTAMAACQSVDSAVGLLNLRRAGVRRSGKCADTVRATFPAAAPTLGAGTLDRAAGTCGNRGGEPRARASGRPAGVGARAGADRGCRGGRKHCPVARPVARA